MKNLFVFLLSVFVFLSVIGSADAYVVYPVEENRAGKIAGGAVDWDTLSTAAIAREATMYMSGRDWDAMIRRFSVDDMFHPLERGRPQKFYGAILGTDPLNAFDEHTPFSAVLVDSCEGAYVFAMRADSTAWSIGERVVKLFPNVHLRIRQLWGRSDFDLDGRDQTLILIYPFGEMVRPAGFVSTRDLLPIWPPSNGMETIHLDTHDCESMSQDELEELLAHEFQHNIALSWDPFEDKPVLEGLATLSEYLYSDKDPYAGYNWSPYIDDAWSMQAGAITMRCALLGSWEWDTQHYASAFCFFQWLYRVYGMDAILKIMRDPYNGKESVAGATGESWDSVWGRYESYYKLHIRADFDGNYILNNHDLEWFVRYGLNTQNPHYDLNEDAFVDEKDLFLFAQQLGITEQEAAKLATQYASQTQAAAIQNYPNPFNAQTIISFPVVERGRVNVQVFNAVGQLVCELYDGVAEADLFQIQWDGSMAASGQYFVRVQMSGQVVLTSRMTLVK